uniref:Uncharacterized protein n=1 Tax=Onchocerca volvulus TaxID=6282 RepID=A0A8R1TVF7_ONCVO
MLSAVYLRECHEENPGRIRSQTDDVAVAESKKGCMYTPNTYYLKSKKTLNPRFRLTGLL